MNEQKLKTDYNNIDTNLVKKIDKLIGDGDPSNPKHKELIKECLNKSNWDYYNCISEYIASIFNVETADMFSCDKRNDITRARWMWWYVLYFLMKKSLAEITIITNLENHATTISAVQKGIFKLSDELKTDCMLNKKYEIIKKLICINKKENIKDKSKKIKIYKPSDVEIEIINE